MTTSNIQNGNNQGISTGNSESSEFTEWEGSSSQDDIDCSFEGSFNNNNNKKVNSCYHMHV